MTGSTSPRLLLVNADDAGLATSTDDDILRCAHAGVLRSATLVVTGPTAEEFVSRADREQLDVGLHVNLTEGPSLTGAIPGVTRDDGRFLGDKAALWRMAADGVLDTAQTRAAIQAEVRAQFERFETLWGESPRHVDGHNHVHVLPVVAEAVEACAERVWIRAPQGFAPEGLGPHFARWTDALEHGASCVRRFVGLRFCVEPSIDVFLDEVEAAQDDPVEFMVHPGRRGEVGFPGSLARATEADVLCDPDLRAALDERGVRLACFREITCR